MPAIAVRAVTFSELLNLNSGVQLMAYSVNNAGMAGARHHTMKLIVVGSEHTDKKLTIDCGISTRSIAMLSIRPTKGR
jgi:hypothetical protein